MAPMVDKPMDSGEARLAALGYKQELKRDFNLFTNTAISFSIISCTSGVVANYTLAWVNGGPATVVWAWIMVCSLTMFIGVAMAEIVSSLPSSGGPYFWSAELSNKAWSPFAAWMTGWFNLLGQVAITAGIDFALANHLSAMIALSNGHICSQKELLLIYGVTLALHALINCLPTRVLGWLSGVSVVWHVLGALTLTILIPVVAPTHQTAAWVFGNFESADVDSQGAPSAAYIFLVGTLMAQFTITGYDACGHMSEETTNADKNAAWGVIIAVGMSFIVGLLLILGMTFSIQDPDTLLTGAANGYVGGQIFYDAFMARYGSGQGGVAAMGIPLGTLFLCGASSVTSNSRMCWSFARDGALPGHQLWSKVNAITGTPINAMLLMVCLAFILGLPMLNSTVAFGAVISISTIGLYISYGIPIVVRLLNNKAFQPGPVYFGRAGIFIGWVGAAWCVAITAIFIMPTIYPVTETTLNYAPVAVGIVLIWALGSFFCPGIGARHWYRGEKHTIEDFTVHKKQAEEAAKGNYASNGNEDSAHNIGYDNAPVKTV